MILLPYEDDLVLGHEVSIYYIDLFVNFVPHTVGRQQLASQLLAS